MKTKQCPSCAMNVDVKHSTCPICQYEYAEMSAGYRWLAIVLAIVLLFSVLL